MIVKEAMNTTIATMKHRTPMPAILEHFGLLSIQASHSMNPTSGMKNPRNAYPTLPLSFTGGVAKYCC